MMSNGWMMDGWGMTPVMWIFMVLLWGIVIFGVIYALRCLAGRSSLRDGKPPSETPLDILKKRYARGEIGKEEFERMKRDLA